MHRLLNLLATAFPVWVMFFGVVALFHPQWFTWFSGPWIVWGLAMIMFGMGITLSIEDFRQVLRTPRAIFIGVAAQYTVMPALGFGIALLMQLPAAFAVGLILTACSPGGTASNVVAYIARANVALSVLMTACSTLAAVVLTPALAALLAGKYMSVDGWGILLTTVQVVLLPVLAGVFLHHKCPNLTKVFLPVRPLASVIVISLICASIIGQNAEAIFEYGWHLLGAVLLLHGGGSALGYGVARLLRLDVIAARTISIEVGMQNSGLAAVLARKHFVAEPLTAVPAAISSVFHSVVGSLLAAWWRTRPSSANTKGAGTAEAG